MEQLHYYALRLSPRQMVEHWFSWRGPQHFNLLKHSLRNIVPAADLLGPFLSSLQGLARLVSNFTRSWLGLVRSIVRAILPSSHSAVNSRGRLVRSWYFGEAAGGDSNEINMTAAWHFR